MGRPSRKEEIDVRAPPCGRPLIFSLLLFHSVNIFFIFIVGSITWVLPPPPPAIYLFQPLPAPNTRPFPPHVGVPSPPGPPRPMSVSRVIHRYTQFIG